MATATAVRGEAIDTNIDERAERRFTARELREKSKAERASIQVKYKKTLTAARWTFARAHKTDGNYAALQSAYKSEYAQYRDFLFKTQGWDAAERFKQAEEGKILGRLTMRKHIIRNSAIGTGLVTLFGPVKIAVGVVAGLGTYMIFGRHVAEKATQGLEYLTNHGAAEKREKSKKLEALALQNGESLEQFEARNTELLVTRSRTIKNAKIARLLTSYATGLGIFGVFGHSLATEIVNGLHVNAAAGDFLTNGLFGVAHAAEFNPDGGKQITIVEHLGNHPVATTPEGAFSDKTVEYAVGQMAKIGHWTPETIKAVTTFFEDPKNHDLFTQAAKHPEQFLQIVKAGGGEIQVVTMNAGDALQLKSMVYSDGVLDMTNLKPDSPIQLIKVNVPYTDATGSHYKTFYIPLKCFNFSEALNSDIPAAPAAEVVPPPVVPPAHESLATWEGQTHFKTVDCLTCGHSDEKVANLMLFLDFNGTIDQAKEYVMHGMHEAHKLIPKEYQSNFSERRIFITAFDENGHKIIKCLNIDTGQITGTPEVGTPAHHHHVDLGEEYQDLKEGIYDPQQSVYGVDHVTGPKETQHFIPLDTDGNGVDDTLAMVKISPHDTVQSQIDVITRDIANGTMSADHIEKLLKSPLPADYLSATTEKGRAEALRALYQNLYPGQDLPEQSAYDILKWLNHYTQQGVSLIDSKGAPKNILTDLIEGVHKDIDSGYFPDVQK